MFSFLKYALDLLLPRECVVCGRRLQAHEKHLCIYCESDFPYTRYWERSHNPMADSFNSLIQRDLEGVSITDEPKSRYNREPMEDMPLEASTAGGCAKEPYGYAAALFFYKGGETGYREITRGLKYRGNIAIGKYYSAVLGRKLAGSDLFKDVDLVVPVPLHWTRRFSRGYNQAEVIANEIASTLGARTDARLLRRNRRTKTQTRLDVNEKSRNVSGAFSLRNRPAPVASHILLVDDVFTTGATAAACHKALRRQYGPDTKISVAALACVLRG